MAASKQDLSRTAFATCPACPKTGSPRGIKHHFTSVHAGGEKGRLAIAYAAVSQSDLLKLREAQAS